MNTQPLGPVILDLIGLALSHEEADLLCHPHVGGVIIFSRNYDNPQQLEALIQQIRSLRSDLILCVDQEGGRVQRLQNQFTRLPHLRMLGELFDSARFSQEKVLETAKQLGYLMALEVRSIGLDLSFAPVLDLDKGVSEIMRSRALHRDPHIVALLADAYIKGMHTAGMRATGKHFPGHGHVKADSHLELPVDNRSLAALEQDIFPFKKLSQTIDALMTAHIHFPEIDKVPATFSSVWLKQILRKQLGFEGTIISDDLTMEGASCIGDYSQRAQTALDAGCDFILVCNNRAGALKTLEGIQDKADPQTYQRRNHMRATQPIPEWALLKQQTQWQNASHALEEVIEF